MADQKAKKETRSEETDAQARTEPTDVSDEMIARRPRMSREELAARGLDVTVFGFSA